ncbi:MAG: PQQ-like beta-propeller repeat protein [Planctomycetes bacterium]|nr:PQQ-like beta-propeller repeat protein [Planctomycetota bacterium]
MQRWILGLATAIIVAGQAPAQNWPVWRGPTGDGVVHEKGFPTKWNETENVTWKTPIPGRGHSSPVLWGDQIFLTTCLEGDDPKDLATPRERQLLCIDRKKGGVLWTKTLFTGPLDRIHKENSHASCTAATDGKHVFVTFFQNPKVHVAAFDMKGNEVWRKNPGEFQSVHGYGIPPILYKDLVIVNCDQDAENRKKPAYIVALDKSTGEEKWRIDRPNRIRSYCPPFIAQAGGKTQMVLTGCKTVASYDPETGKQIWNIEGPTEQFVASMILHKGHFYLTAGFPTYHVMCIKPDGVGNISETIVVDAKTKPPTTKPNPNSHVVWHESKGAGYVPSPVAHGDNIFLVHDDGRASCRNAMTGELYWLERLGKHHHASGIEADGHIYFVDDEGITHVVKASKEFEVIAKNPIGELSFSSPAFARGQIFIRGSKHLFCIGKEKID